jgi:hypothetical protein
MYCSAGGVLLEGAQLCGITAQYNLLVSGKCSSPASAYRLSTPPVLKAPVQRCIAELWIGSSIDKILLDAEAYIKDL